MDIIIDVALLMLAVVGSVAAIGGETWRKGEALAFWRRLTRQGRLAATCLILGLCIGVFKEIRAASTAAEAAEVAATREKNLLTALASADAKLRVVENRILTEQQRTLEFTKQTTLAMLDLQTPTRYRDFTSFRLGVMWFWLGYYEEAVYHFRHEAAKRQEHLPSLFNLALSYAAAGRREDAKRVFATLDVSRVSKARQRVILRWRQRLAVDRPSTPAESALWELWFPL